MAIKSYSQFVKKASHLGKAHNFGAGSKPKKGSSTNLVKKIIKWVKKKLAPSKKKKK
jgi:hypothetical protein